ncbi:ankyrin repeat family A protein 2-like isoform X2 [Stylophora pistillata]|uniref:ankyrin repeat family A protein 2-like isoform X2 n=1 Tax=Stylophora pistillata TaxID=50429 RepID=UPI000C057B26|nr:ankyrin repeat family A protein 2-like isoform X2 [Stylophora pistillata]
MSASEQFIQAIQTGDLVYVEKHLRRPGTEINAEYQDLDGMTPLMAAVDKDHLPTAAFLLKEGADPTIEDETGKTAFDIAKEKNFTKIQLLLEEYKK